jgi:hypothetical protein
MCISSSTTKTFFPVIISPPQQISILHDFAVSRLLFAMGLQPFLPQTPS